MKIILVTAVILACLYCPVSADEDIELGLDYGYWKVADKKEEDKNSFVVYIPGSEDPDTWTEKVTIYKAYGTGGRPDVIAHGMKAGLDGKYPYVISDIIRNSPDDIIYELCFGESPMDIEQAEIGRIIRKKKFLGMISYVLKNNALSSDARQKWISTLEKATIFKEPSEGISLDDIITYTVPDKWEYNKGMKRWSGTEPSFALVWDFRGALRATLYGLSGSKYGTPEEFESVLNKRFPGDITDVREVHIDGRKAKAITMYYVQYGYTDDYGSETPREFVYDEFVILPLDEGFIVFNLVVYWENPFEPLDLADKNSGNSWERMCASIYEEWQGFLDSCKLKPEK